MKKLQVILAQLVDTDDLKALDATELRAMLADLDDQIVYSEEEVVEVTFSS